jgi:hypothetical protein
MQKALRGQLLMELFLVYPVWGFVTPFPIMEEAMNGSTGFPYRLVKSPEMLMMECIDLNYRLIWACSWFSRPSLSTPFPSAYSWIHVLNCLRQNVGWILRLRVENRDFWVIVALQNCGAEIGRGSLL